MIQFNFISRGFLQFSEGVKQQKNILTDRGETISSKKF